MGEGERKGGGKSLENVWLACLLQECEREDVHCDHSAVSEQANLLVLSFCFIWHHHGFYELLDPSHDFLWEILWLELSLLWVE